MRQVKGYRIVDIPMGVGNAFHSFFLKENSDNKGVKGVKVTAKTLFVGNIDYCKFRTPDEVDGIMKQLFGVFGDVESISVSEFQNEQDEQFDSEKTRFAHIVFEKKSGLKSCLLASDEQYEEIGNTVAQTWGIGSCTLRKSRSELHQQFLPEAEDLSDLKVRVNIFLEEFEESEAIALKKQEQLANQADADGFMPVKNRYLHQ